MGRQRPVTFDDTMLMRPDWVILGIDMGDEGVAVIASSELTQAELRNEVSYEPLWAWSERVEPVENRFIMETTMTKYVWIRGKTYRDALRTLFERWEPGRKDERSGRYALPEKTVDPTPIDAVGLHP